MTITLNIFVVDTSRVEDIFGTFVARVSKVTTPIIRAIYEAILTVKIIIINLAGRAPPMLTPFLKGDSIT